MPFYPDAVPHPPRSREKAKIDRDCERQCTSLFVPAFKAKHGKASDPNVKKGREECFCVSSCAMQ